MADQFSRRRTNKELAQMQRWVGIDLLWPSLFILLCIYILFVVSLAVLPLRTTSKTFASTERSLLYSKSSPLVAFVETQRKYRSWLERHGTRGEVRVYNSISESLFMAALGKGTMSWLLAPGKFIILRLSFLIIAAGRLWVFMILLAVLLARRTYAVYDNRDDILGQTGNGRVFYTGVRAELKNLNHEGAPDVQVVGLACPPVATEEEVMQTPLGEFLAKIGADNETNVTLAAILLASDGEVPPFAAPPHRYTAPPSGDTGLYEVSYHILAKAFSLCQRYKSNQELPGRLGPNDKQPENLSVVAYLDLLERAMNQCLPKSLRDALAGVSPEMLVTTILAFQAGKVLSYADEGGRWIQKSNFPQLSARAILHSIPAFAREYDFGQRKTIRRSLIYGSRSSVFGPVRFARDLTDVSRALRQWVELLMETPARLITTSHSVELFALVHELHEHWKVAFSAAATTLDDKYQNEIHATQSGLFLVPVAAIIEVARKTIAAESFKRLGELTQIVYNDQQNTLLQEEDLGESINTGIPEYEKVFSPFTKDERKSLSELHGLDERDIKQWSPFRVVLYNFGWLARRVGDYTVPESSVIFTILRDVTSGAQKNELGFIGQKGIVPIRGTRLVERIGKNWSDEFSSARTANMAETKEQYERLMKGITDDLQDDIQQAFAK